jgi:GNAT superfamily N-acetyltransferase
MIFIRRFRPSDILELLELGKLFHAESSMSWLPFDESKVASICYMSISNPDSNLCLVAEHGVEGIIGSVCGVIVPYYFNDEKIAQDRWIFVDRHHRGSSAGLKLLSGFYEWAEQNGALEACVASAVGIEPEKTEAWLNKIGYQTVGFVTKRRIA